MGERKRDEGSREKVAAQISADALVAAAERVRPSEPFFYSSFFPFPCGRGSSTCYLLDGRGSKLVLGRSSSKEYVGGSFASLYP